jgi:hypothetical protein
MRSTLRTYSPSIASWSLWRLLATPLANRHVFQKPFYAVESVAHQMDFFSFSSF